MASAVIRRVEWRGQLVRQVVGAACKKGVRASCEAVLDDAQEHVPFDKGTLHDSAAIQVEQERTTGGQYASGFEGAVSYDTPYAVKLHEHPDYNFQNGREGKWLEHALQRHASSMERTMGEPIAEALRAP